MRAPVEGCAVAVTRSQRTGGLSPQHGAAIQGQWQKRLGTV